MCEVQGCAWDSPIGGLLLTVRAAAVRSAAQYCRLHCVHSICALSNFNKISGYLYISGTRKGGFPKFVQLPVEDKPIFGRY